MKRNFFSKVFQASLLCCLAVMFTACDDIFGNEDNPMSAYLSMNDKPVTLKVGDTHRRKAVSVSSAVVEYTSSNANVATVDNEGLVTAKAEGTTTITATATGYSSQNGKKIYQPDSKSYVVTVKPATLPAATITTAPTATTGTIAANSTTALVTAGVADGGTMMYKVTTTNTKPTTTDGFDATVPTAATLAAATYYVWYYVKADATHADSEISASAIAVTLSDVYAANDYNKGSWDSTNKKVVFTKLSAASATAVTNSDTDVTWGAGWYTVSGNVTINGKVTLGAETHLILQDGATLTINGQLDCRTNGKNLYVYGQEKGDGKLNVTNNSGTAINSNNGYRIDIHGGEVTASAAGEFNNGLFTGYLAVYGGKLTATSGGDNGIYFGNTIDVYGGEVVATSNSTSSSYLYCGIRSTSDSASKILTVYGGKVTATGNGLTLSGMGAGIACYVKSGISGIKFYFSDDGTTWGDGTGYDSATSVGRSTSAAATQKRYAKAE